MTGPARRPAAPRGIHDRGRRLWRWVVTEFELQHHELEVLAEACRTLDRLDVIRDALDTAGPMSIGSRGQAVVHPLLAEERRQRDLVSRLLTRLGVPADDGVDETAAASKFGRRGAAARWFGRGKSAA